jgi:hypothetical protein
MKKMAIAAGRRGRDELSERQDWGRGGMANILGKSSVEIPCIRRPSVVRLVSNGRDWRTLETCDRKAR